MSKIWEIIEHKDGADKLDSQRQYRMSGRRESDEYTRGMKDGFCKALDMMEEYINSFEDR